MLGFWNFQIFEIPDVTTNSQWNNQSSDGIVVDSYESGERLLKK
jgi:hypothetical protein